MKQILLTLLCFLLAGCTTQGGSEEKKPEIVYIAAQYCADDECYDRRKIQIDVNQLDVIRTYLDQLPEIYKSNFRQYETAKLVMIDENGYQHVLSELVESDPSGNNYTLNYQGNRLSWDTDEKHRLTEFLRGLEGQLLSEDEPIGYEIPASFHIISHQGYRYGDRPTSAPTNECSGYNLLFYINESFTDVAQIKDQNLLLSGIVSEMEDNHYHESGQSWNNQLILANAVYEYGDVEAFGNRLIQDYQIPSLFSSQIGVINNSKYYYDSDKRQFFVDKFYEYQQNIDMVLVPIYTDGEITRVARFKVNREKSPSDYYEMILDDAYTTKTKSYSEFYNQLVMHLDQVDLFDVVTDERGRLQSVKVIQLVESQNEPINSDSFVYTENDLASVYTMQTDSYDALLYNMFMNDKVSSRPVRCSLHESDTLLEIVIDSYTFNETSRVFFDKASGKLLSEGMINKLYYKGEMKKKVIDKLKNMGLNACPASFQDNKSIERCYVEPIIDTEPDAQIMTVPQLPFKFNEANELVVPVLIKSYGGYQETLEIIP